MGGYTERGSLYGRGNPNGKQEEPESPWRDAPPGRPDIPLQLAQALEGMKVTGNKLGAQLATLGVIGDDDLTQFLSKQYGCPQSTFQSLTLTRMC